MKGEWKVSVRNRRNTYTFTLRRNITVLTGNSGDYFLLITREYLLSNCCLNAPVVGSVFSSIT